MNLLKKCICFFAISLCHESWNGIAKFLVLKMLGRLYFHLELQMGKNSLLRSFQVEAEFIFIWL